MQLLLSASFGVFVGVLTCVWRVKAGVGGGWEETLVLEIIVPIRTDT